MHPTMKPDSSRRTRTEESHDKHKERAFVAASRRTDRSIEARLQSARRASEIHQKRTGKAFRISEAIIMNEEMYEEEDDYPRSRHLLPPHMLTPCAEMNSRVNSYLTTRAAMSALAAQKSRRESEVTEAFAQFFPQVDQTLSQHWPTQFLDSWLRQQEEASSNTQPFDRAPPADQQPEEPLSGSDVSTSQNTSPMTSQLGYPGSEADNPLQPFSGVDASCDGSAFTSDLPLEARMTIDYTGHNFMPAPDSNNQAWTYPTQIPESYEASSEFFDNKNQQYGGCEPGYAGLDSTWNGDTHLDCQMDDLPWEDFINEMSQVREG